MEDSAPVVTPPVTIPKHSALAEKPHHRDSFACLDSPLKSLPDEVADLGSFSRLAFPFNPSCPALSGGLLFREGFLMTFPLVVSTREKSHSSLRGSLFFIHLRIPSLLLICYRISYASSLSYPSCPQLQHLVGDVVHSNISAPGAFTRISLLGHGACH